MVRLADLHEAGRASAQDLACPTFDDQPFTPAATPASRKLSFISSAGLIERGDAPFNRGDAGYRNISASTQSRDILISHLSINFDRTAAIDNIETILPRHLSQRLVDEGLIGDLADTHYSFMGATEPEKMESACDELATELKKQGVNTVVLLPV